MSLTHAIRRVAGVARSARDASGGGECARRCLSEPTRSTATAASRRVARQRVDLDVAARDREAEYGRAEQGVRCEIAR
jgi:hypothetical protein